MVRKSSMTVWKIIKYGINQNKTKQKINKEP